jgi:hypothetical protein
LQEVAPLRWLALAWLVFALLMTAAGKNPQLANLIPDVLLNPFTPNDKQNLAPYRVLHLLALAFLFTWYVPRDWQGLRAKVLQPIIKCGDEWFTCFCAGVFLSLAGHLVLIMGPNSLLLQVLVSVAGAASMTLIAWYVSWSRQQDGRKAFGAA